MVSEFYKQNRKNPTVTESFLKQCEKASADPFKAGKSMGGLPRELQGSVYRLWIKGPKGFRFIYVVHRELKIVMGVFVSADPRSNFDYNKVPWLEYAEKIYEDLTAKNMKQFEEWEFGEG